MHETILQCFSFLFFHSCTNDLSNVFDAIAAGIIYFVCSSIFDDDDKCFKSQIKTKEPSHFRWANCWFERLKTDQQSNQILIKSNSIADFKICVNCLENCIPNCKMAGWAYTLINRFFFTMLQTIPDLRYNLLRQRDVNIACCCCEKISLIFNTKIDHMLLTCCIHIHTILEISFKLITTELKLIG